MAYFDTPRPISLGGSTMILRGSTCWGATAVDLFDKLPKITAQSKKNYTSMYIWHVHIVSMYIRDICIYTCIYRERDVNKKMFQESCHVRLKKNTCLQDRAPLAPGWRSVIPSTRIIQQLTSSTSLQVHMVNLKELAANSDFFLVSASLRTLPEWNLRLQQFLFVLNYQ